MRHLAGVILAIVLAAAVFFAASWGYMKLLTGSVKGTVPPAVGGSLIHDHAVLEGFGALLAVGLLAGLLIAMPRVSPLAAGLPGLALLGWTGLYLSSARRAVQYIPLKSHPYGAGFEALLFDGILAMAGLVLVIPLFVPSRWTRRDLVAVAPAPYEASAPDYPDLQATQTIGGGLLADDWTATRPQPRPEPGPSQAPWGPAEPAGSETQNTRIDWS